jgi:hypothetical protein
MEVEYLMRLFTDRHGQRAASAPPEDVAEVLLSSLVVRRPRQFGACWVGCKLWEELGLGEFWQQALGGRSRRSGLGESCLAMVASFATIFSNPAQLE